LSEDVKIHDLTDLRPPKQVVKIREEEIDVTIIPFNVFLEVAENLDKLIELTKVFDADNKSLNKGYKGGEGKTIKEMVELMQKVTTETLKASNRKYDEKWFDSLTLREKFALMNVIIGLVMEEFGGDEVQKKT